MIKITEIRSLEQLGDLEPAWTALLARSGAASPFLTFEWIDAWWRSFGDGRDESATRDGLRVLVADNGGEPVAIAPLMMTTRSFLGTRLTVVGNICNDHSFRAGLIVADPTGEALRAMLEHLRATTRGWDVISLCYLDREHVDRVGLPDVLSSHGGWVGEVPSWRSPYVPVTQGWDDYFATVGSGTRSSIRRKRRKLEHMPGFEIHEVTDATSPEVLDAIFEVDRKSWQYANRSGLSSEDSTREFYARIAREATRCGWFRGYLLSVSGKPIAYEFNLLYDGVLYNLKLGYDTDYAQYSPGLVLRHEVLKEAFGRGLREIDFLGVEDSYKLSWTDHAREHVDLHVCNPSSLKAVAFYGFNFKLKSSLRRIRPVQSLVRGARSLAARRGGRQERPNGSRNKRNVCGPA
jgi:CelD/BcsL family acetyltransferase involved in cellulose biosynthesis